MSSQSTSSANGSNGREAPTWGWLLVLWMALIVVLNGLKWTTGVPDFTMAQAVEDGAAQVETKHLNEDSEDVVRKAIQSQRDTLRFWTVIVAIRDFLIAPAFLWLRAFAVAVAMSAVAAMCGRPVRFPDAVYECIAWQGVWVLGLAVSVIMMLVLQRSVVSTSLVMFLPQDTYTATQWIFLQHVDLFALIGWLGMAWSAWRRGQTNFVVAPLICLTIAAIETLICGNAALIVDLGMRASLMPQ